MSRRKYVLMANLIKFGVPLGLLLAVGKICFAALFSDAGVNFDILGQAATFLVMGLVFGIVLALLRLRNVC